MNQGATSLNRGQTTRSAHSAQTTIVPDLPPHDFTAGPMNVAPVGGYADLARGAPPQPMAMDHSSLMRGPSYNRGPYEAAYGATGGNANAASAYDYNGQYSRNGY